MTLHARGWVQSWLLPIGLMLGLGGACVALLSVVERERPPSARAAELSYLPRGDFLRVAVLGYREVAADLIWLKAVQHLGGRTATTEDLRWAYHVANVVTDLDPQFVDAYLATGTILGVWAGLVEESITLLKKGMRHNPDVWQLPFVLGYDYFYELCDPGAAAGYFRIASELPGSPPYLPRLAARMTMEAGDPDAALEFLQRLVRQVRDERLREAIEQRMREVVAERDIRLLEHAVQRFRARYGRGPATLDELVRRGVIAELPEEPLGGEYQLDRDTGAVRSTGLRERLKVHRHVACQQASRSEAPGQVSM